MMNPLLDDTISKDRLILFYEDLAHIAVNMRLCTIELLVVVILTLAFASCLAIETAKDKASEEMLKYLHRI